MRHVDPGPGAGPTCAADVLVPALPALRTEDGGRRTEDGNLVARISPPRLRGDAGDVAPPFGAEHSRARRAAAQTAEAAERGRVRVACDGHGAPVARGKTLRRRMTTRTRRAEHIGIGGLGDRFFPVADEAAAAGVDDDAFAVDTHRKNVRKNPAHAPARIRCPARGRSIPRGPTRCLSAQALWRHL